MWQTIIHNFVKKIIINNKINYISIYLYTYAITHAQPHMFTTTHSAPRDKQTVRLAWLKIIIIIIINIILTFSPAGAESDSNPTAPTPSQTEITDLNCSDHSTASKEMVAWRALVRIHLTRTQNPTPRCTMVWLRYCSLRPQRRGRNRKDVEKREERQREKVGI